MALFDYTGQLPQGELFEGTLDAPDQDAASQTLASMGVTLLSIRPAKRNAYTTPLSLDDFTFFNEQIARITHAKLPLEESLRQLAADVTSKKLKRLLLRISQELSTGASLEEVLERHKAQFPVQYANVIQAGLRSGDLGGTLYGLTRHLQLKSDTRRALLETAAYPLIVLVIAFVIIWFYLTQIVPAARELLLDYNTRVPAFAQFMFAISDAWPTVSLIFLIVAALAVIAGVVLSLPFAAGPRDGILRRIPLLGRVYVSSVLARFCHTAALGAYANVPLPELVAAGGAASGSVGLGRATQRVAERLRDGAALRDAAASEQTIPGLWICAVEVAAPRGDLAASLAEVAKLYEIRARQWLATLRVIVGPLLFLVVLILLGGMLAGILALFSTFLNLVNALSG